MSNNVAVVLCRSIQKRNKEERSNLEMLLGILGNPWVEVDPNTAAPARYIPTVNPETEAGPIVTKNPEMERMGGRVFFAKKVVSEFRATLAARVAW